MLQENTASFAHANRKPSKHFKWLRANLTFYAGQGKEEGLFFQYWCKG